MRYYYKSNAGKGFLNLKSPIEDSNYTEITEEEFIKLTTPKEVTYTAEQSSKIENQNKIAEYRQYLADTDYIVLKISEALAEGDTEEVEKLKTTYGEQLAKRKEYRKMLNELA